VSPGLLPGTLNKNKVMSRRKTVWPQLLSDGGWRQRKSIGYWPNFVRVRKGKVQEVSWTAGTATTGTGWILTVSNTLRCVGSLDEVLTRAESI